MTLTSYYIFYHGPTNRSMYSRQGRIEKLTLMPDGSFPQVHMTSQGSNGKPLPANGSYPASCVCILHGKKPQGIAHPMAMRMVHPFVTQDQEDFPVENRKETDIPPRQYITNGKSGLVAGFRYFDVKKETSVSVMLKGNMKGTLEVRTGEEGPVVGTILLSPSDTWKEYRGDVKIPAGVQEIYFAFQGRGKLDMLSFAFE